MTATVLFVHGTGVRTESYLAQLERVRANVVRRRPDVAVLDCEWGDKLGAAMHAEGASVPAWPDARRLSDERAAERDWRESQWALLNADPLHELRLIASGGPAGDEQAFVLRAEAPGDRLTARARALPEDPALRAELADVGLAVAFAAAVPDVLDAEPTRQALAAGRPRVVAGALGRAILAEAIRRAAERPEGPVPVIEARRERLLLLLLEALGHADLGFGSNLARTAAVLAWRWAGAGFVQRRRGAITDATSPMAGDILLYLSRGQRIRDFIRARCRDVSPPVVLVAHSLGGIACVDLLASEPVPEVAALVTVGSQAPYLYELNALPSLTFGEPLPDQVPPWTNFYDPRDLLAYVGAGIFPGRVRDVAVPSGNPFPFAHSDYFGNPTFYDRLCEIIP
ncbi:hypothetical protein [Dactylosporangium sp. CA-139066]|uniref:hypothetical protein n=1 Tax=Dactylosporangium sp. CA-139066 TaxID=3239930 RepID=UPI003D944F1C